MAVEVRRTAEELELGLTGEWGAQQLSVIDAQLAALNLDGAQRVLIETTGLSRLDLSGAWALREFLRRARESGAEVRFRGSPPDQLRLLDETLKDARAAVSSSALGQGGDVALRAARTGSLSARVAAEVAADAEEAAAE